MSEIYYILNYADYPNRPSVLFEGNTSGLERKNNNNTKFVVRGEPDCQSITWISELETPLSRAELDAELANAEWNEA